MNEKILHIIMHDVPWPADFGGVMDLFYKIKCLHKAGVKIHLHCFVNKRAPQPELEKYCLSVTYYKRKKYSSISFKLPFIVSSRINKELIANLQKDDHPVIIEGIHCSYYLHAGMLNNRKVLLRLHNTEYQYYSQLAIHEKNFIKKIYFSIEGKLLKKYEKQIASSTKIATVSEQDEYLYKKAFGAKDIFHLPVFIPFTEAMGLEGNGCYCLYHGNLSINENEKAAVWLLKEIFTHLPIPFVIAGKDPSATLEELVKKHERTCLVANPGDKEMHDLIAKAQVNILPSFNNTGVKLKLLNALYNGRHCIVNKAGVTGSKLDGACTIVDDAETFKTAVSYLYHVPYSRDINEARNEILRKHYNNQKNTETLLNIFWP
ncbi:MAG: glycosyltransferase family 4 protein [Ferruginibacter sp.]